MKPFNLKEAKAGKPVCTRDGKDVTIVYFSIRNGNYPVLGVIHHADKDTIKTFTIDGKTVIDESSEYDLFMKTTKQQGWINIFKDMPNEVFTVYKTEKAALRARNPSFKYPCDPIQIEWEE